MVESNPRPTSCPSPAVVGVGVGWSKSAEFEAASTVEQTDGTGSEAGTVGGTSVV